MVSRRSPMSSTSATTSTKRPTARRSRRLCRQSRSCCWATCNHCYQRRWMRTTSVKRVSGFRGGSPGCRCWPTGSARIPTTSPIATSHLRMAASMPIGAVPSCARPGRSQRPGCCRRQHRPTLHWRRCFRLSPIRRRCSAGRATNCCRPNPRWSCSKMSPAPARPRPP